MIVAMSIRLSVPRDEIQSFCRRNQIRRLAFFGSVIRDDFTDDSDVDVIVEFDERARVGLFALAGMEDELSAILGRKVDLLTPKSISKYFRDKVLAEAEEVYVAA